MFLKDLKEIPGLENCFVLEPEHSLQKIRKLEQKYGMTFEEAKLSNKVDRRDLALWEHSLAIIELAKIGEKQGNSS